MDTTPDTTLDTRIDTIPGICSINSTHYSGLLIGPIALGAHIFLLRNTNSTCNGRSQAIGHASRLARADGAGRLRDASPSSCCCPCAPCSAGATSRSRRFPSSRQAIYRPSWLRLPAGVVVKGHALPLRIVAPDGGRYTGLLLGAAGPRASPRASPASSPRASPRASCSASLDRGRHLRGCRHLRRRRRRRRLCGLRTKRRNCR
jgi:hypothetical protein